MQELLVADSFRVRVNAVTGDAEVRGARHHLERFVISVQEVVRDDPSATIGMRELHAFLWDSIARITAFGDGWPRLELWRDASGEFRLSCQLRLLPPLGQTLELHEVSTAPLHDRHRKGPNIALFAALNREVSGEALLLDPRGFVSEGATTSLVWWHHDRPPHAAGGASAIADRVPSVTERLIDEASSELHGQPLTRELLDVSQLSRCEVWAVNALHGLRVVTSINGVPLPAPNYERLRTVTSELERRWQPLRSALNGEGSAISATFER